MSNKNNKFGAGLGWLLLIIVVLIAIPMPPLLFLALMIVLIFRIPRCLWDKAGEPKNSTERR